MRFSVKGFFHNFEANVYPAGNYMLKLTIETLEQGVKHVQN